MAQHLGALLLGADHGTKLCFDSGADHMNGVGSGSDLHAVAALLLYQLRLIEAQIGGGGHYDAVALLLNGAERGLNSLIFLADFRQLDEGVEGVLLITYVKPCKLADSAVIYLGIKGHIELCSAVCGIQMIQLELREIGQGALHVTEFSHSVSKGGDRLNVLAAQVMVLWEGGAPGGHIKGHLTNRKLTEDQREDLADVIAIDVGARDKSDRNGILFLQAMGKVVHLLGVGCTGVKDYGKWLPCRLQLGNYSLLRRNVIFSIDTCDSAVGGD